MLSLGISAGCDSDDDGPLEGDWIAADGSRLLLRGSEWSDSDGDAGTFSSSGRYPEFTLVFRLGGSQFSRRANFYDTKTFDLCTLFPDGSLDVCIKMVYDRPTLHWRPRTPGRAPMRANWSRIAAALLVAAGLGCSSGSEDSCDDVSGKICDTLEECGSLSPTFGSNEECVASFNGYWEVVEFADEECRTEWTFIQDLTCDQLLDYFSL